MIRISAGSAACMGLTAIKMDAYPTTAYLLSGSSCMMGCSFCPQGSGTDETIDRLGRVNWPGFTWEQVKEGLDRAEKVGIKRICLQSVRHNDGIDTLVELINRLKGLSNLPLSVSAWLGDQEEASALVKAGADRISVSLDVVNPNIYQKIKGGSLEQRLNLLLNCADHLPGKVSTHIICGLGESEKEALQIIDRLVKAGVTIALFAFVPLKGTPLEGGFPPPVDSYRRIQAGYYLLKEELVDFKSFKFERGKVISFGLPEKDLEKYLSEGSVFQTTGCPDCNRPFYNERPGGIIYNYHRALSDHEKIKALDELFKSFKRVESLKK